MKTAPKGTAVPKAAIKKKKEAKNAEDSISETISFVIKGKLTPIKQEITPITLDKKLQRKPLSRIVKKKVFKKTKAKIKEKLCKFNKTQVKNLKQSPKKKLEAKKKVLEVKPSKNVKKVEMETKKKQAIKKVANVAPPKAKKKKQETDAELKKAEDLKTKETIEKLLKQATRVLKAPVKRVIKPPKKVDVVKKVKKIKTEVKKEESESDKEKKLVKKPKVKTNALKRALMKKKLAKLKLKKQMLEPKRHREASLNALAKVHCLYENESRFDGDFIKHDAVSVKEEFKVFKNEEFKPKKEEDVEVSTRTLRCQPGLRGFGKHWVDSTSSSEENSSSDVEVKVKVKKPKIKREVVTTEVVEKQPKEMKKVVRKKRRNQTELFMDLKDMVVRKRMASLNASAILAASYSTEKKSSNQSDDTTDSDTESEYVSTDEEILKKKCYEDDVKKEEKLIEVHTTPNKKVAVILNQDTDVTITGVYVNSTTRSTHHEGYCSIAGMQYRISATSHTQTAATAVATETLLQTSTSAGGPDNSTSDSIQSSTKSYTPLDALSNMQPPPGPGIQHGHPGVISHGPVPVAVPVVPPHAVLQHAPVGAVRHGCSSAFTSPHAAGAGYPPPPNIKVHPEEGAYMQGYYQPAGPLISVPHAHGQPPPHVAPPPPPPTVVAKTAPLSDASPAAMSPPPAPANHLAPPPAPSSNGGDSSDSDVIITSVTAAKDTIPQHPQSYRFSQYPSTPPGYAYTYPPYPYPTPPPPTPPYAHHELCYPPNPYVHHKYPPPPPPATYRRYLSSSYYPSNAVQEVYSQQPGATSSQQQVVQATPVSAAPGGFQAVPSGAAPTLIETYSGPPPPTLMETYQPPPPHYYAASAYGPAPPPSCYTHSPSRSIPYINATYQSCPCPMQSCPKNVITGPLTGDSKRSALTLTKDSMPLSPVALALPLEPSSATEAPSPARGSAGMPPPPSPAGAVYQSPAVAKEESHNNRDEAKSPEKKRKARVGKAMVRNDIRQNTMLLMCNPDVKREIESPKDKDVEVSKVTTQETKVLDLETSQDQGIDMNDNRLCTVLKEEKVVEELPPQTPEPLPPCIPTVAENVKVKNMKRKSSISSESVPEVKKPKPEFQGSYKNFIKKEPNVKITNGKRKLLTSNVKRTVKPKISVKKTIFKNAANKRLAPDKKRPVRRNPVNSRLNSKLTSKSEKSTVDETIEEVISEATKKQRTSKKVVKKEPTQSKKITKKVNSQFNKVEEDATKATKATAAKVTKDAAKISNNKEVAKATKEVATKVPKAKKVVTSKKAKAKCKEVEPAAVKIPRRSSLGHPKWSNGWKWEGEPYEGKVFINSDETIVTRTCYPAMRHTSGDILEPRDCVLLKAGPRKNDLPFVAKIAALWENAEDGEMMMSLLWYYRPEHTEHGRAPTDCTDEVFASRHKDSNSVACIDDKCYVLTFNEYCRYRKNYKRLEEGLAEPISCIPQSEPYPRLIRQPPDPLRISPEMVFFCRRVYDFRQKRIIKNPT
ncbi:unnamed protein product [Brassicogethes aeneus]|uniref:BAH domain-containing protein n=1 Tax=Brassicogethes aeneus TaxID=1431903 RepID=A0A9P0FMG7_BRAAE|nr:unnamed protein product [Brassicogethes aeneus]